MLIFGLCTPTELPTKRPKGHEPKPAPVQHVINENQSSLKIKLFEPWGLKKKQWVETNWTPPCPTSQPGGSKTIVRRNPEFATAGVVNRCVTTIVWLWLLFQAQSSNCFWTYCWNLLTFSRGERSCVFWRWDSELIWYFCRVAMKQQEVLGLGTWENMNHIYPWLAKVAMIDFLFLFFLNKKT